MILTKKIKLFLLFLISCFLSNENMFLSLENSFNCSSLREGEERNSTEQISDQPMEISHEQMPISNEQMPISDQPMEISVQQMSISD